MLRGVSLVDTLPPERGLVHLELAADLHAGIKDPIVALIRLNVLQSRTLERRHMV